MPPASCRLPSGPGHFGAGQPGIRPAGEDVDQPVEPAGTHFGIIVKEQQEFAAGGLRGFSRRARTRGLRLLRSRRTPRIRASASASNPQNASSTTMISTGVAENSPGSMPQRSVEIHHGRRDDHRDHRRRATDQANAFRCRTSAMAGLAAQPVADRIANAGNVSPQEQYRPPRDQAQYRPPPVRQVGQAQDMEQRRIGQFPNERQQPFYGCGGHVVSPHIGFRPACVMQIHEDMVKKLLNPPTAPARRLPRRRRRRMPAILETGRMPAILESGWMPAILEPGRISLRSGSKATERARLQLHAVAAV